MSGLSQQQLQQIAITMIALAKSELEEDTFAKLSIPDIQSFVVLMAECVPLEYISDQILLRHAIEHLSNDKSVEEAVMHVFILYIFRLTSEGSNHPLERGIIRQQIIGILPIFETAVNKGLISTEAYDKNADALSHIADTTGEVPEILEALSREYRRLA